MAEPISEEIVVKVLSMLPDHPTVEQLMETGEFDSSNTVYAALRILEKRGKVQAAPLIPYGDLSEREK